MRFWLLYLQHFLLLNHTFCFPLCYLSSLDCSFIIAALNKSQSPIHPLTWLSIVPLPMLISYNKCYCSLFRPLPSQKMALLLNSNRRDSPSAWFLPHLWPPPSFFISSLREWSRPLRSTQPHGHLTLVSSSHLQDLPCQTSPLLSPCLSPLYCCFSWLTDGLSHQVFEIILGARHCIRHLKHKTGSCPHQSCAPVASTEMWNREITMLMVKGKV